MLEPGLQWTDLRRAPLRRALRPQHRQRSAHAHDGARRATISLQCQANSRTHIPHTVGEDCAINQCMRHAFQLELIVRMMLPLIACDMVCRAGAALPGGRSRWRPLLRGGGDANAALRRADCSPCGCLPRGDFCGLLQQAEMDGGISGLQIEPVWHQTGSAASTRRTQ